jgi:hypothetical protein
MSEELTVDQAVAMMNGEQAEATTDVEPINTEPEVQEVEQEATEEVEQTEEQAEVTQDEPTVETPAVDYTAKIKFKANGVEVEKSIQDLINDAQLASNYNQKMQELAAQRKAFDAAMQQNQQPAQADPAKTFEDLNNEVTARAMKMLGLTNPEDFEPDAMGVMGSKVHYAAYQKALLDIQQEHQSAEYAQQQERIVDESYYSTVNSFAADPQFEDVKKFAIEQLYEIPKKGAEGAKEFQRLYNIYQKTELREQHWQEMQQYGRSNVRLVPFTSAEVAELNQYLTKCKALYQEKQTKSQVKAQVPKSIPIKPTVKVESSVPSDAPTPRKVDFKKIQSMDLDDIAKLL